MDLLDGTSGYLEELLQRIVAAEREFLNADEIATKTGYKIDSVPYFFHHQTSFPYITHRLGEAVLTEQSSDYQTRSYAVTGRFVCGHVTQGYAGESERLIYRFLPFIETLYTVNINLISEQYPDAMPEGSPEMTRFVRDTGTRFFDNRGLADLPNQAGFEFSVRYDFTLDIRRHY